MFHSGIEDLSKVEGVVQNKVASLISIILTHYKPDAYIDLCNNLANTVYSLARQLVSYCDDGTCIFDQLYCVKFIHYHQ